MKFFYFLIIIVIIFNKTGNVLSDNNLFNVNNILIENNNEISSQQLLDKAIKKGFKQLLQRVLLKEDILEVSNLDFAEIKKLVLYYNISKRDEKKNNYVIFNITFDKDKIHNLFFQKNLLYSDISDKELYVLPILLKDNNIFIFSNNFFYENWNNFENDELIEHILPLENIEIIQKINEKRNNLLNISIDSLLEEYSNKNLVLVFIELSSSNNDKIYLKTRIQDKIINKNLTLGNNNYDKIKFKEKIILKVKDEITNLVKSQNLIDIRTPSFLNVKLNLNKDVNLFLLNSKIKNIDLIENIFVQEFSKDYVNIKIKYLGKLEKILYELNKENISLQFVNDQWVMKLP